MDKERREELRGITHHEVIESNDAGELVNDLLDALDAMEREVEILRRETGCTCPPNASECSATIDMLRVHIDRLKRKCDEMERERDALSMAERERDDLIEALEEHEDDLRDAAGECLVPLPEPGSMVARLVRANNLMRRERDEARRMHHKLSELLEAMQHERDEARAEVERLTNLINTPHTVEFHESVRIEAAHQRDRWGDEHDERKSPADWLWAMGYLVNKAVHDVRGKRLHHIVASAALLANWYRIEHQRSWDANANGVIDDADELAAFAEQADHVAKKPCGCGPDEGCGACDR